MSSYSNSTYYSKANDHRNSKDFRYWRYPVNLPWFYNSEWDLGYRTSEKGQDPDPARGWVYRNTTRPKPKEGVIKKQILNDLRNAAKLVRDKFDRYPGYVPGDANSGEKITLYQIGDSGGVYRFIRDIMSGIEPVSSSYYDPVNKGYGPPTGGFIQNESIQLAATQLQILAKYLNYANYSRSGYAVYANGSYSNNYSNHSNYGRYIYYRYDHYNFYNGGYHGDYRRYSYTQYSHTDTGYTAYRRYSEYLRDYSRAAYIVNKYTRNWYE